MPRYSSILHPASIGQIDGTDKLNCSVRALANCTEMPISNAKKILEENGRLHGSGVTADTLVKSYKEAGLSFVGFFGESKQMHSHKALFEHGQHLRHKGMTLATFCKTYNRGSYVVVVKGHALCVRGGQIIDSGPNSGNKIVLFAWKK